MNQPVRLLFGGGLGIQSRRTCTDFCERAKFMSGETEELKRKLEEMLTSSDTEWVNSITVTLNAMHRQFKLERQRKKTTVPFGPYWNLKRAQR